MNNTNKINKRKIRSLINTIILIDEHQKIKNWKIKNAMALYFYSDINLTIPKTVKTVVFGYQYNRKIKLLDTIKTVSFNSEKFDKKEFKIECNKLHFSTSYSKWITKNDQIYRVQKSTYKKKIKLPETLETLTMNYHYPVFFRFPKSLKYLSLKYFFSTTQSPKSFQLPKSLKYLSLDYIYSLQAVDFPPLLEYLSITNIQVKIQYLNFPNLLRYLTLSYCCLDQTVNLPPLLEYLKVIRGDVINTCLPNSLKYLCLERCLFIETKIPPNLQYLELLRVESDHNKVMLPISLKHFKLEIYRSETEIKCSESINYLIVYSFDNIFKYKYQLPKKLKILEINHANLILSLNGRGSWLVGMPGSHVRTYHYKKSILSRRAQKFIVGLPKSLNKLSIDGQKINLKSKNINEKNKNSYNKISQKYHKYYSNKQINKICY